MYWSRKFRTSNCITNNGCNYIGIPKNDKRHAIHYNLSNCDGDCSKIRKNPRVRNNKEEMEALRKIGIFNDVYKNREKVVSYDVALKLISSNKTDKIINGIIKKLLIFKRKFKS